MKISEIRHIADEDKGFREMPRRAVSEVREDGSMVVEGVAITANVIDSHGSIFTRECLEDALKGVTFHNANHIRDFENLITNEVEKEVRDFKWSDLGGEDDREVAALVFRSKFTEEDNPMMYRQYKLGKVHYHSIEFDWQNRSKEIYCIKDGDLSEREAWDKYYPQVVNKGVADKRGWFYVYEKAPILGVSAVVLGSNKYTPTLSARGYSEEDLIVEKPEVKSLLQRLHITNH